MNRMPQISDAEYEVMKVVWHHAPINTNEVIEQLISTTSWSAKTIQTMLLRLVKKGALTYQKEGRIFVYTPTLSEEEYLQQQGKSFLNRFYNGAFHKMVSSFLESDLLSVEDLEELRTILDHEAKKKKG